ncbi:hypothetical protein REC12_23630 [Desulfosporosinus sp. PR]|uniref:hypothetical protein n=1 Tax=Candidatus Desulfosporosinus nitrosoreducens TaxID=3401928 RepID=UPI0027F13DF4|nr:hypothetical protein [Desulfosporosinus sp. PR]MDQ7096591.1 hypothetical protein [Desulfosporosinus sp. PR]
MKKWTTITILTGFLIATAAISATQLSASTIPLESKVKMEAGLSANANIPVDKYQALLKEHQIKENALNEIAKRPPASKTYAPPVDLGTPVQGPKGILSHDDSNPGMLHSWQFTLANSWVGDINNIRTVVYAGAEGSETGNPKQGVLWVLVFQPDGSILNQDSLKNYKTSALDGSLNIVSVNGNVLTLKAALGTTYTFDIATRSLKSQ